MGGGTTAFDSPTSRLNIGIPKKQYIKVTKLNARYDSYRYSVVKATRGKAAAASELRRSGFEDALFRSLGLDGASSGGGGGLAPSEMTSLVRLERDFLASGAGLVDDAAVLSREIANAAVLDEMDAMGVDAGVLDVAKNATVIDAELVADDDGRRSVVTDAQRSFFGVKDDKKKEEKDKKKKEAMEDKKTKSTPKKIEGQSDIMRAVKELEAINTEILLLELDFVQSVVQVLGPNRADAVRTAIVGNAVTGGAAGSILGALRDRPLSSVLSSFVGGDTITDGGGVVGGRKNLYVTRFPGDVSASQLNELREEVTAILRSSSPGDEALLVLQSGGGTVTGYGLAAAQLQRFKSAGMKLTVCVEQVAASGGYMMCCVADRIVASPFAILGSIGVISDIPNVYERLKEEGIEFQTITAGKYKRTVTPTKKVTKDDLRKSTEDIQEIFDLFKGFVKSQRPSLDIEDVATGDTWFGEDALARGLCDELSTADDVLLEFVDGGFDVYEVSYEPPAEGVAGLLSGRGGGSRGSSSADVGGAGWRGAFRSAVRGVVSDVKDEVMAEISSTMNDVSSAERRVMARDDSADRIQFKD